MSHVEPERGGQRGCPECGEPEGHNENCPQALITGDYVWHLDKPTTSEWTEQTVNDLIYKGSRGIAIAHNAAIAAVEIRFGKKFDQMINDYEQQLAAKQKEHAKVVMIMAEDYDKLSDQLAAEREKVHKLLIETAHSITALEKQLAAERERSKELSEDLEHYSEVIDKREQQLAAEREKVAELEQQNKTFRAAQKACEDCDGPTMAEVQQLREQLAAERKRHGDEMTSVQLQLQKQFDAALAKVKEGK
jgi:PHD/YefM family antitoxin component YafN of YafNO toxin-antitoxin module